MESENYKKLYIQAFNYISDLIVHAQTVQQELEELYIDMEDDDGKAD